MLRRDPAKRATLEQIAEGQLRILWFVSFSFD
jgi:hypothetical protein